MITRQATQFWAVSETSDRDRNIDINVGIAYCRRSERPMRNPAETRLQMSNQTLA